MRLIILTEKKFGRWTVIKRELPNTKDAAARWLCKCSCGKEKIILGNSLRRGDTKSCGCLRKERVSLPFGFSSMRAIRSAYKRNAKRKEVEYTLTEKQFKELTQQDCHYCGAKPNNRFKNPNNNGDYIYNGLDRVENNKGYTTDNVVPCCNDCNRSKYKRTLPEFKDWVERIYNNTFNKKGK